MSTGRSLPAAVLLTLTLTLALAAAAHALTVTEVPTPVKGARAFGLAVAQDGGVWYGAVEDRDKGPARPHIGRIDPRTLRVQTFPLSPGFAPFALVQGTGGAIWGSVPYASTPRLVRIDPVGRTVREVTLAAGENIARLVVGAPGGRIFGYIQPSATTEPSLVVEIDPASGARRVIARSQGFTVPAPIGVPGTTTLYATTLGIAATPAGIVWAMESHSEAAGTRLWAVRIDPDSGATTRYDLGTSTHGGEQIAAGPGDEAWLMRGDDEAQTVLYRVTASDGQVRVLPAPENPLAFPIVARGAIWGTDGHRLVRLDPATGQASYTSTLTPTSALLGLAVAPDGALWTRQIDSASLVRISEDDGPSTANAAAALKRGLVAAATCSAACSGQASIEVTAPRGAASAAAGKGRVRTIGRARFRLASSGQKDVRVPISRSTRRWLKTRRSWRATLHVRTRVGSRSRSHRQPIVLRFYPPLRAAAAD